MDWKKFFDREAADITPEQWVDAYIHAKSWNHCPCCFLQGITRNLNGSPCNETLYELGSRFGVNMYLRNFSLAKQLYQEILDKGEELTNNVPSAHTALVG